MGTASCLPHQNRMSGKNATTHIELVANLLTRLEKSGVCLRETEFTLQTDNTTRESKNSIMLAFLCSLVSKGTSACIHVVAHPQPCVLSCLRFLYTIAYDQGAFVSVHCLAQSGTLKEATLSCLRSGHSHEDIDQVFGRLARWIISHGRKVETPNDFVDVIGSFLKQADFPHEPVSNRVAFKLDQTRDWSIDCSNCFFSKVPQRILLG